MQPIEFAPSLDAELVKFALAQLFRPMQRQKVHRVLTSICHFSRSQIYNMVELCEFRNLQFICGGWWRKIAIFSQKLLPWRISSRSAGMTGLIYTLRKTVHYVEIRYYSIRGEIWETVQKKHTNSLGKASFFFLGVVNINK